MKNAKATFVTIIIAVMLAIIDAGMFILLRPAFFIITGIFAVLGFIYFFLIFRLWLSSGQSSEKTMPPIVIGKPVNEPDESEKPMETDDEDILGKEPAETPSEEESSVDAILSEYHAGV